MKIAYVLNCYPQPSQSFIWREIHALERQGAEIARIAMRPPQQDLVDADCRAERLRTHYILKTGAFRLALGFVRTSVTRPRRLFNAARLAWICGRASASGVLRHMIYLVEACEVARLCDVQGITHVHAHFGTNSTMVAMLAEQLGGAGYSFTVHGPEEFDSPNALSLGTKILNARRTVAVSYFGRSQLCRWVPAQAWRNIVVVHCGVELAAFPDVTPMPELPLRLVSVGRFVEQKGHPLLLEAIARLGQIHPEISLTLIGDGPMRPALEQMIDTLGIGQQVRLTGWLDQDAIRSELDKAHVMVMPSFAEGLPVAIMEAMAAGRPVIASGIAGIPELVQHGMSGWLVPPGDALALAGAMTDAAKLSGDALARMGDVAREVVLKRHDVDREAARLYDLIRSDPGP